MECSRPAMLHESTREAPPPPSQIVHILTWLQPAELQLLHPSFGFPCFCPHLSEGRNLLGRPEELS